MGNFDYSKVDYVDVAERIRQFREIYPEGSLQPWNQDKPFEIVTAEGKTFIAVVAAAYRAPDDHNPGVGMAWEPLPGTTPYTRNSELQNAETSAWGRAIVAALAADTKKGVASADEVRNRQADRSSPAEDVPAQIRATIKHAGEAKGLSVGEIAEDFRAWSKGSHIGTTTDVNLLRSYLAHLNSSAATIAA